MKKNFNSLIITTGLAIFSMFFGAGNLMYPLMVGMNSADHNLIGILGFIITATIFPTLGLVAMILFDGDYQKFFGRLGTIPSKLLLLMGILLMGLIAMPRIVTLSYVMTEPFLPNISLPIFSFLFLALTFVMTVKEGKIMDLLGRIVSPLLLVSLFIIIIKGYVTGNYTATNTESTAALLWQNIKYGYKTLDILGAIFFASIVHDILKKDLAQNNEAVDKKKLAMICLKSGIIGSVLLGIIYVGLSYLGAFFGHGLGHTNEGELFREVSFRVLGSNGALIISTAVLMACLSTIVALAAIVAVYLQQYICKNRISYVTALLVTLAVTLLTSNFGLSNILKFSSPIIIVVYPVFITVVFCNLAYKLFDFKPIKVPALITILISLISYFM